MSETNIDEQILQELSKIKELTVLISKAEEKYNNSINLLDKVKKDFEVERKNREDEFTKWQVKYSDEMKSLNKGLENYIKLIPKDNSTHISNLQIQVDRLENLQSTKHDKLEKNQKRNTIFIIILVIMNLISYGLIFLK